MAPRSFHFIPAHRPRLLERLDQIGADRYIFDLEDAVPLREKEAARRHLDSFLQTKAAKGQFVRIHEIGDPEFPRDAALLRRWSKVGVVLPKFSGGASLAELDRAIGLGERAIIITLETFGGVRTVERSLEDFSVKPYAIALGFEDMLSSVPHAAADVSILLLHIRTAIAIACRAHNILGIDGISGVEEDKSGFERHCQEGRSCGLHAKFSIHPKQIEAINRIFGTAPEQVRWAELVRGLTGLRDHYGYEKIGDCVITPPKIKKARHILNQENQ